MLSKTFGEMVGSVLKENRYSQRSLAIEIDRSNTYIHNIIRGKTQKPERDKVVEIAKILKLDVEESLEATGYALVDDIPREIVKAIASVSELDPETVAEIVEQIDAIALRKNKLGEKELNEAKEIPYKKGVSEHKTFRVQGAKAPK